MNAAELKANPRLDTFFVRNLNKEPRGWALEDQSLDAVTICVRCASLGVCANASCQQSAASQFGAFAARPRS